jgi:hypothetical protein
MAYGWIRDLVTEVLAFANGLVERYNLVVDRIAPDLNISITETTDTPSSGWPSVGVGIL